MEQHRHPASLRRQGFLYDLGSPSQTTERNNLYNVSSVTVCTSCPTSANVSYGRGGYTAGFDRGANNLVGNIQNADGWFMTLPAAGERNLSTATVFGGSVYITSFVPSTDICMGAGTGYLYGLYYLTGTPNTSSALGITTDPPMRLLTAPFHSAADFRPTWRCNSAVRGQGQAALTSSKGCSGRATRLCSK